MNHPLPFYSSEGKISHVIINREKGEVVKEFYRNENVKKQRNQIKAGRGSHVQSFIRELECLKRLQGCRHFPQLIDYNEEELWIRMSYCGEPYPVHQNPRPANRHLIPQAQQIIDTLEEKNIKYSYIKRMNIEKRKDRFYEFFAAQNLHMLDDTMYMIDFEYAYPIGSRYDQYFEEKFKERLGRITPDKFIPLFTKLVIDDCSELSSKAYQKSTTKLTTIIMDENITKKWIDYQFNPVGDNIQDRIEGFGIASYSGSDKTMIDIGANHGRFGIELQKEFKHIDCVEPFCPAPDPMPNNMTWHGVGFRDFVSKNDKQWDLVLTFACTIQIKELDLMPEYEIARDHADLVAPGGYLIYETQKKDSRKINQMHVDQMLRNLKTYLGPAVDYGSARKGGRMYYVFHKVS